VGRADLLDRFPHLTCEEMFELKRELELEKELMPKNDNGKILAIALMLAGIKIELVNRGEWDGC
jgi:hypothetical protein